MILLLFTTGSGSVSHSVVADSLRPQTVSCQVPLFLDSLGKNIGVSAFPSPGDLPNWGIEPRSPALQADSLPSELQGKPSFITTYLFYAALWKWGQTRTSWEEIDFCVTKIKNLFHIYREIFILHFQSYSKIFYTNFNLIEKLYRSFLSRKVDFDINFSKYLNVHKTFTQVILFVDLRIYNSMCADEI